MSAVKDPTLAFVGTTRPALGVVKPGRKVACCEEQSKIFEECIENASVSTGNLNHIIDGVFYIDNVLSAKECSSLCAVVDEHDLLSFWSTEGRQNESVRLFRDADTIEVNGPGLANSIWSRISILLRDVLNISVTDNEDDPNWERELIGTWNADGLNKDLLFARYPCYGAFSPHTDGRAVHDFNVRSFYSVILFLNDIPAGQGGGTRFYQADTVNQLQKMYRGGKEYWTADESLVTAEVQPRAGRMLCFHQAHVHEGIPPLAPNLKYIIRSDIMLRRSPALCNKPTDETAYTLFRQAEDLAEAGQIEEATPLFRKALKMSPEMARIMGHS